jgi:hypothetical protein
MTANKQLKAGRQVSLGGNGANGWPNNGSLNGGAVLLYCTLVYAAAAAKYQQLNGFGWRPSGRCAPRRLRRD